MSLTRYASIRCVLFRVIAILMLVVLVGCDDHRREEIVPFQEAVNGWGFLRWCKQVVAKGDSAVVTPEVSRTVGVLLRKAGECGSSFEACERANGKYVVATELELNRLGLSDIRPLRSFNSLQELDLDGNGGLSWRSGMAEAFPQLRVLRLSRAKIDNAAMEDIVQLKHLELLDISHTAVSEKGLSKLAELPKLVKLGISGIDLDDFGALARIRTLEHLTYRNSYLENLKPLSGLDQITSLDLSYPEILRSLAGIEGLGQLKHLEIQNCYGLSTLDGIERVTQLESLDIGVVGPLPSLKSIEPLKACTKLRKLKLFRQKEIESLLALQGLGDLEYLDLTRVPIKEPAVIEGLKKLRVLKLTSCGLDTFPAYVMTLPQLEALNLRNFGSDAYRARGTVGADVRALSSLDGLKELDLSSLGLKQIDFLESFPDLEQLFLDHNEIETIDGLGKLEKLTFLGLDSNKINDIGPLRSLKQLEELDLGDNLIGDYSPLTELSVLQHLYLRGNPKPVDLEPLLNLKGLYSLNMERMLLEDRDVKLLLPLLRRIKELNISGNAIRDGGPLMALVQLEWLEVTQRLFNAEEIKLRRHLERHGLLKFGEE